MADLILDLIMRLKDEATEKLEGVKKGLGGINLTAVTLGVSAVAGIGLLAKGLIDCGNEAAIAEQAEAQLAAAVQSTGGKAGMTVGALMAHANALEATTRAGADVVNAGQSMLLTFTNIGKDVFPNATETMLDMVTAMSGGAAPTAEAMRAQAIQLGKALNDPIAGISALSKVGVTFTDQQKATIKSMVDMGNTAGAQKVILDELAIEFGGSAAAAAKTYGGQMDILNNKFGAMKETIGGAVLPIMTQVATSMASWATGAMPWVEQATVNLGNALQGVFGWIGTNVGPVVATFMDMLSMIKETLEEGGDAFNVFGIVIATVMGPTGAQQIEPIMQRIRGVWETVTNAISAVVQAVWPQVQNTITVVMTTINEVIAEVTAIVQEIWAAMSDQVQGDVNETFPDILSTIKSVMDTIILVITTVLTAVQAIMREVLPWIKEFWAQHGRDIIAIVVAMWEMIRSTIENVLKIIRGIIQVVTSAIKGDWQGVWDGILLILTGVWDQIKNVIQTSINLIDALTGGWLKRTYEDVALWFGNTKDKVVEIWNALGDGIRAALDAVTGFLPNTIGRLKETALSLFTTLKTDVFAIWDEIKYRILHIFDGIHIPMPHITIHWDDLPILGHVPTGWDLEWYARGANFITNGPTIIGVGEAGPERVIVQPLGGAGKQANGSQGMTLIYNDYRANGAPPDLLSLGRRLEWQMRMRNA